MEQHALRHQAARLEREYSRDPDSYRKRVVAFAFAGYAYVHGLAVLLAFLSIVCIAGLFQPGGFFGAVFWLALLACAVYVLVGAFRVRIGAPPGINVSRRDSRRLFEIVESLRKAAGAPKMHAIILTTEFAIRTTVAPRAGMLGPGRNQLAIGLPVLLALTQEEFIAALAHELAHVSAVHGKAAAFVHRARLLWHEISAALGNSRDMAAWPFRWFAGWYGPLFDIHTYVLERRMEIEADKTAARLAGAQHLALALVRMRLCESWLEKHFWPDIERTSRRSVVPPEHVFIALTKAAMSMPQEAAILEPYLDEPVANDSAVPAYHLPLLERLKAIKQPLLVPQRIQHPAAQEMFASELGRIETKLSELWSSAGADEWALNFDQAKEDRKRLAQIESKRAAAAMSRDEAWERATILRDEGRDDDYLGALEEMVRVDPQYALALYALGKAFLERGEDRGLAILNKAMELSESGAFEASKAAQAYLRARGSSDLAQAYAQKASEYAKLMDRARAERSGYTTRDAIEPHGVKPRAAAILKTQCTTLAQVREVYVVRKRVTHLREEPVYVLGVYGAWVWWRMRRSQAINLRRTLKENIELSRDWFCVVLDFESKGFQERFKSVAGAPLYVRE